MKPTRAVSLLLPLALWPASRLHAQDVEKEIRRLEQAWATASEQNDTAAFNRLMAPDSRLIRTDGVMTTRQDRLRAFSNGEVRTTSLVLSDVRVRVAGNDAIVTGMAARKDTAGGKARDFQYRYTRIWQRADDGWRVVLYQATTYAPGHVGGLGANADAPDGDIAAIREREDRYAQLQTRKDTAEMRRLLDDSFLEIDHHGNVLDKARRLAGYASNNLVFESVARDDVEIRVYGPTAVFTARSHATGLDNRPMQPKRFDVWHPLTHVWVRTDDAWRLVSEHNSDMGTGAPSHPQAHDSAAELRFLQQLDWQRFQAVRRADLATLDTLLADDWLASGSSPTTLTKAQYMSSLATGTRWYGDIHHDDVRVRLYGDAAVVTGRSTGPYRVNGREIDVSGRFTHMYVRRDGRWRMVGMHNSSIAPTSKTASDSGAPGLTATRIAPSEMRPTYEPPTMPGGEGVWLEGALRDPAPYTARFTLPDDYKVPVRVHARLLHIVVLSGALGVAFGDRYDEQTLKYLPPGGLVLIPAETPYFMKTRGRTTFLIYGEGPWSVRYINPAEDPRTARSRSAPSHPH